MIGIHMAASKTHGISIILIVHINRVALVRHTIKRIADGRFVGYPLDSATPRIRVKLNLYFISSHLQDCPLQDASLKIRLGKCLHRRTHAWRITIADTVYNDSVFCCYLSRPYGINASIVPCRKVQVPCLAGHDIHFVAFPPAQVGIHRRKLCIVPRDTPAFSQVIAAAIPDSGHAH